jgi:fibronectin-binding autotransporter adhesin
VSVRSSVTLVFGVLVILSVGVVWADDWSPLWTTSNLSVARCSLAAASTGTKVVFAGGYPAGYVAPNSYSNVVDIYDTVSGTWSTSTLPGGGRVDIGAAASGQKIYFAGGRSHDWWNGHTAYSNAIDIYDTVSGTWSASTLSYSADGPGTVAAGTAVFFAGGDNSDTGYSCVSTFNILNTATNSCSTGNLSLSRAGVAATAVGTNVLFAGGWTVLPYNNRQNSNVVDVYNTTTLSWSTTALPQAVSYLSAATVGNRAFFAGDGSNTVYIYDATTGGFSTAALSQARNGLAATTIGTRVFFAGGASAGTASNVVDIYDASGSTWSSATLSQARDSLAATSLGNKVFFGGGSTINGTFSNVVDIYTLQSYPTITSSKAFALCDQTTVAGLMQLNAPGSLALSNFNLHVGSMSGNAPIDLGNATLTAGSDNSTTAYSGVLSGSGNVSKVGTGTLILDANNSYSGYTAIAGGVLKLGKGDALSNSTLDYNNYGGTLSFGSLTFATAGNLQGSQNLSLMSESGRGVALTVGNNTASGTYSGALSGSGSLTKAGLGIFTLSGSSTYTGGTTISQGTLNVTGSLSGGNVLIAGGAALTGSGIVNSSIAGAIGSVIAATGNLTLGASTSYEGFSTAGRLDVGPYIVTLNSQQFAGLGTLTTIAGGTLNSPSGIFVGGACSIVGSGTINGRISAGWGSTISAAGALTVGDSASTVGFQSDGELYANGNTLTINDKNAAVLGSLTQLDGGTLIAPNGYLLNAGNNLISGSAGGNVNGSGTARFLNRGYVEGPAAEPHWLVFNLPFKGSTGQTAQRVGFTAGFSPGDSPGVNDHNGDMLLGGTSEFDIGGVTPGNGDGHYSQLNVSGELDFLAGATLSIEPWGGFVPSYGDDFTILTWGTVMSGSATILPDPSFAAEGIEFLPMWNSNSLVLRAVPEPSSFILLGVGAAALAFCGWRRKTIVPIGED